MSTTRPPACSQTTAKAENKKCPPRGNLPCGEFCKLTVNWFEWSVCIANMKRQFRCHEVLSDARMKQSAWQTFGVMPSNFIWRSHTSFFMHRRCASLKKAARRLLFSWHPLGESNPQLPLRREDTTTAYGSLPYLNVSSYVDFPLWELISACHYCTHCIISLPYNPFREISKILAKSIFHSFLETPISK